MADPPPAHHCKDCGLVFDSGKSLDVHLHYHKENLLSKWAQQQPGGEESNNNHVHHKKPANNRTPAHPPPATPDSSDNRGYYQPQTNYLPTQQPPEEPSFILGTGSGFPLITRTPTPNSSSSPSPHSNNSYHRYHPYQHAPYPSPSPDHHRNGLVSSSSPQQCDKCGFICESAVQLIEHNAVAHSNNHVIDHQHHNNMFQIKAEPSQAEILDLDSHKVHVYQPPQRPPQPNIEQDRSVSALMSWVNDSNKEQQQHRFHQQSGLASPDCYGGAVSTTTLTPPEPDPISRHRPPDNNSYHAYEQQQQHLQQQANNQQQISSSQLPPAPAQQQQQQQQSTGGGKSKSGSGGSWKSNEARRPKTYNCSACNKWFTSSGHLKRHYNTTLHKNAVKSSGVPDPASMPISVHHHPQKEAPAAFNQPPPSPSEPPSPQPVDEPPPQPPPPPPPLQPIPPPPSSHHLNHLNHLNHFLPSPPNLMAGSSEVTGGLLLHTTPYHQELLSQQQQQQHSSSMQGEPQLAPTYHLAFSPHPQPGSQLTTFTSPPPPPATANPNFQPPHVSTIGQLVTTTSSISGNNLADIHMYLTDKLSHRDDNSSADIKPLPSFSQQFVNHFVSLPQVTSSQSNNVGGPTYHFDPSFGPVFDDNLFYTQQLQATLKAEPDFVEEEAEEQPVQSPVDEFPTSTQASPNAMFNHEVEHIVVKSEAKSSPSLYEMIEEDATVKSEDTVSSTIESSPISATRAVRGKEEKIYRCEDCDKIFNKVCYLTQHNKSFHAGNKPYKCERCGKRFLAEDERQVHASKHAGDKPYKCDMCPKQFNHKTDLRRHMCLHTGDKPFACEQCGKGFIRKDHMLKHCETHKKRSRAPPGHASPQAQAKKQLKMKLQHGSKLAVQPNPPPLAAMQMVM